MAFEDDGTATGEDGGTVAADWGNPAGGAAAAVDVEFRMGVVRWRCTK